MGEDPKPGILSEYDMHDLPEEGHKILGRWAMGSSATEGETKYMSDFIKSRQGNPMFGSSSLEREMLRIKRGK